MCGGTDAEKYQGWGVNGLSPRVRGNLPRGARRPAQGGSIPACAGEPGTAAPRGGDDRVYPRVCGGTRCLQGRPGRVRGLSPRVRGNRELPPHPSDHPRSIPACAGEPWSARAACARPTVYPRVCGGTQSPALDWRRLPGLSPRVRGNLGRDRADVGDLGSIPACAGEPRGGTSATRWRRVYPRVCGGTVLGVDARRVYTGLSPRVRGNRRPRVERGRATGSIPACAGEPTSRQTICTWARVYPRVCGGTRVGFIAKVPSGGLSPRVRGNRGMDADRPAAPGSIPACAGEPPGCCGIPWRMGVYPRVCGGTLEEWALLPNGMGLSPRVRGNRRGSRPHWSISGSIPACAGEPRSHRRRGFRPTVYPRVCGGTLMGAVVVSLFAGLSPRVRGNREGDVPRNLLPRSIPACAGEPRSCPALATWKRVYPRVCGGTVGDVGDQDAFAGLSPRVRGNPGQPPRQARRRGSIPACAGEPTGRVIRPT